MDDLFSTLLAIGAIYGVYRWFFSSNLSSRPNSSHNTSHIRQSDVQALRTLFPQLDNSSLVYDLIQTRSIERTAENVLRRGRLPAPPSNFHLPSHLDVVPLTESITRPSSEKKKDDSNLIKKYELEDKDGNDINVTPSWGTTSNEREKTFKDRKAKMILDARKRLIDKKKNEIK